MRTLAKFLNTWKTDSPETHSKFTRLINDYELEFNNSLSLIDTIETQVEGNPDYTDEERSIISQELKAKKIFLTAKRNLVLTLPGRVAEAVVTESELVSGGKVVAAKSFKGEPSSLYGFYNAILKKIEKTLTDG